MKRGKAKKEKKEKIVVIVENVIEPQNFSRVAEPIPGSLVGAGYVFHGFQGLDTNT